MTTPDGDARGERDDPPAGDSGRAGGHRPQGDDRRELWEQWAAQRRADGGRGWGPGQGPPWSHGGPPWGPGRDGPWRGGRGRGFGCLFGLVFLVFVVVLLSVIATVLSTIASNAGPIPAVIVVLVAVAALTGLGRGLRRNAATLDSLVDATRRVEDGDYSVRVDVPDGGFRPVRQLVRGFDTMVERLEVDESQRRSLLADVSHELRTPLTVISGNLEAMIDGVHPIDEARPERDPRRNPGHGAAHRRPPDGGTVGGRHPHAASGTDRPGRADRRGRAVVRGRGEYGRGDRHGRGRGRPADPRRGSGSAPGSACQSRRERDPAHAGRWHGRRSAARSRAIGSCCASRIQARASIRPCSPTSSIGS